MSTDPLLLKQSGQYYFYHNDHLGTPQKLTAVNGAVVWAAKYNAFGKASVSIGTVDNPFRFAGQYYDNDTGLHYNWHRYFDIKIGRYLKTDPIGFFGGINLYEYVSNNPINNYDIDGLLPRLLGANPLWHWARHTAKREIGRAMPDLKEKVVVAMAETIADVVEVSDALKAKEYEHYLENLLNSNKIANKSFNCNDYITMKNMLEEANQRKAEFLNRLKKANPNLPWDAGMREVNKIIGLFNRIKKFMEETIPNVECCVSG